MEDSDGGQRWMTAMNAKDDRDYKRERDERRKRQHRREGTQKGKDERKNRTTQITQSQECHIFDKDNPSHGTQRGLYIIYK